jgi:NhaA family Na+:H+ antiporter
VLLAFAIPFSSRSEDEQSPSHRLEHVLHKPVAFVIMPIFALANAGIVLGAGWMDALASPNGLGILGGLVIGKPFGIALATYLAVMLGICALPGDLRWPHVVGAGFLGGIGFTMSIFIANLAFAGQPEAVNASKMAILVASLVAGGVGYAWLRKMGSG